ncbi:MAG: hypothetical protein MJY63_02930 [Paludibacteraceae bacterium]|nr:hypothetical protein [Paludibacteraceae bacterium]
MKNIKRVILTLVAVLCCVCTTMAKDPRSSYSKHSALPKEKTGFRLYGDFMLTADFADTTGEVKPAFGLAATPGAQITNYFFLGGKVGAMYMLNDFFAFPTAVNVRWTFGRKNILTISQSGGVAYCEDDFYPYVDFYFGGRIPLRKGKCLVCALGYTIFPQYNLHKVGEDETVTVEADGMTVDIVTQEGERERKISSWVSPQLTIAYPFRFEKKNRIRYRVHKFKPHVETQGECKPKSTKSKEKEKSSTKPYEKIDEKKKGRAEKTDVERWNP